jgi:hypothetical protein
VPARAGLYRQSRLRAVKGLDLALLVDRKHQRLRRRVEIEADDVFVFDLLDEIGVARQLEGNFMTSSFSATRESHFRSVAYIRFTSHGNREMLTSPKTVRRREGSFAHRLRRPLPVVRRCDQQETTGHVAGDA